MRDAARKRLLLVEAGGHRAGLPLASTHEVMRPLPIEPLAGAPDFVLGLAVIRGASVPVVDLGGVLGRKGEASAFRRFATLDVEGRAVALALDSVTGVVDVETDALADMPPLLGGAASQAVEALGLQDAGLLLVLRAARLVPAGVEQPEEARP